MSARVGCNSGATTERRGRSKTPDSLNGKHMHAVRRSKEGGTERQHSLRGSKKSVCS